jgi:hypothetical protein
MWTNRRDISSTQKYRDNLSLLSLSTHSVQPSPRSRHSSILKPVDEHCSPLFTGLFFAQSPPFLSLHLFLYKVLFIFLTAFTGLWMNGLTKLGQKEIPAIHRTTTTTTFLFIKIYCLLGARKNGITLRKSEWNERDQTLSSSSQR